MKPCVMACLDVSSAMPAEMVESIKDHLWIMHEGVKRNYDVDITVVEFDTQVRRVTPFLEWLSAPPCTMGPGGCSYSCLLEDEFLKSVNPYTIIVFSDGYGVAPSECPFRVQTLEKREGTLFIWTQCGNTARVPVDWGIPVPLYDISNEKSTIEIRKLRSNYGNTSDSTNRTYQQSATPPER